MPIEYGREGATALLALANPPVNALSLSLRRDLVGAFATLSADPAIAAVVVYGSGKGFCAGGDRSEFGTPAASARPTLSRDVLHAIEHCGKPVVAAMHGFAIGGGLELALACDLRVVVQGTRVGLPEVGIGRFPLSGSQRLPRVLGIVRAAEWMLRAEILQAERPDAAPLFDRIVDDPEALLQAALALARSAAKHPPTPIRHRPFPDHEPTGALREVFAQHPQENCSASQRAVLAALQAAVESEDFQAGLDRAQELFDELVSAAESGAPP
jgi:enoyl-CoA hydratase